MVGGMCATTTRHWTTGQAMNRQRGPYDDGRARVKANTPQAATLELHTLAT